MATIRYCAECGAQISLMGTCTINAEHGAENGGFFCPSCGEPTPGDKREGTACLSCRIQE